MTNFRKAIVHHAEDISAWRNPNVESQMHWVADLFVNNSLPTVEHMLEDIYKRTNNIEDSWVDNDGVICYKTPMNGRGHRSTSVGDTIQLWTTEAYHSRWKVSFDGFENLDEVE